MNRYIADIEHPRGPYYVAVIDNVPGKDGPRTFLSRDQVHRYWPILTPDGGIMFASTEDDAERIAATLNELASRVAELEAAVGYVAEYVPERALGKTLLSLLRRALRLD